MSITLALQKCIALKHCANTHLYRRAQSSVKKIWHPSFLWNSSQFAIFKAIIPCVIPIYRDKNHLILWKVNTKSEFIQCLTSNLFSQQSQYLPVCYRHGPYFPHSIIVIVDTNLWKVLLSQLWICKKLTERWYCIWLRVFSWECRLYANI